MELDFDISQWSMKKKIFVGVIALLILWLGFMLFFGTNAATQKIDKLAEGSIKIINNNGKEITLDVKISDGDPVLAGVDPALLKTLVIYSASAYPASGSHMLKNGEYPFEVALFGENGNIIDIYSIKENGKKTVNPDKKYQYVITAYKGFLENKNITVNEKVKLLPDTLEK